MVKRWKPLAQAGPRQLQVHVRAELLEQLHVHKDVDDQNFHGFLRSLHPLCTSLARTTGMSITLSMKNWTVPGSAPQPEALKRATSSATNATPPPPPASTRIIQEPTLGLLGAALDECKVDLSFALHRALESARARVNLPKEATPDGQVLWATTPV